MDALIRYYFHKECTSMDEFADMWCKIVWLEKKQILPVAQIPLKFK